MLKKINNEYQSLDYYEIPYLSNSCMNNILKSPQRFWKFCPLNPEAEKDAENETLINGRLRHTLLFEPEAFDNDFYLPSSTPDNMPVMNATELKTAILEIDKEQKLSGKTVKELAEIYRELGGEAYTREEMKLIMEEKNAGKIPLTDMRYEQAKTLVDTLKGQPEIINLFDDLHAEKEFFVEFDLGRYMQDIAEFPKFLAMVQSQSIEQKEPKQIDYKFKFKAKLDGYKKLNDRYLIVDYKTLPSIEEYTFADKITKFGYHRQAYLYRLMFSICKEVPISKINFAFVIQNYNYSDEVALFEPDEEMFEQAEIEYKMMMCEFFVRYNLATWRDKLRVKPISLPHYYSGVYNKLSLF